MNIPEETRRVVQQWFDDHEESRAILRGEHNREREAAYEMLLCHVFQALRRGIEWREWLEMRAEVQQEIKACCEALRHS